MNNIKFINFKRDWNELCEQKKKLGDSYLLTGLTDWDNCFGGLRRGGVSLIAAPSGHGKTTFLLGMSKILVSKSYKVLYIGTEQTAIQLMDSVGRIDIDFVLKDEVLLEDIFCDIEPNYYDVVIYDYLGAESGANTDKSEWQEYRDQCGALSSLAIKYNFALLTACQADPSLLDEPNPASKSSKFISYAKHIQDKLDVGIYMWKNKSVTEWCMFKNRYHEKTETKYIMYLDYENKIIEDYDIKEN